MQEVKQIAKDYGTVLMIAWGMAVLPAFVLGIGLAFALKLVLG